MSTVDVIRDLARVKGLVLTEQRGQLTVASPANDTTVVIPLNRAGNVRAVRVIRTSTGVIIGVMGSRTPDKLRTIERLLTRVPSGWSGPWPDPFTAPGEDHDPVIVVCDDQAAAIAAQLAAGEPLPQDQLRRMLARALTDAYVAGAGVDPN